MTPVIQRLNSTHKLLLSLWSNGSGGPPGFLENAHKENTERFKSLDRRMDTFDVHKDTVDTLIAVYTDRRQHIEVRNALLLKFAKWAVPITLGAMLSITTWGIHKAVPIVQILWEDYLREHPSVEHQMKNVSQSPKGTTASDAGLPQDYVPK